jgi:hypothetical protein
MRISFGFIIAITNINDTEMFFCIYLRGELGNMKKFILAVLIATFSMGMFIASTPVSVAAQKQYMRRVVDRRGRVHWVRVNKPSYYRRHRNRINMAAGTGGGALIGGLLGGKKGALIGGGVGLGSSALYTYKLNKKRRVYRKVRRY